MESRGKKAVWCGRVLMIDGAADSLFRSRTSVDNLIHHSKINNPQFALELLRTARIDVVLLPICTSSIGVLDSVQLLKQTFPSIKVVVALEDMSIEEYFSAFRQGADDVLQGPVNPGCLAASLCRVSGNLPESSKGFVIQLYSVERLPDLPKVLS